MYLLDPDRGKRRRALVPDQAVRSAWKTRDAVESTARDAQNRAQGLAFYHEILGGSGRRTSTVERLLVEYFLEVS